MSGSKMHPPANGRCQIYAQSNPMDEKELDRCENAGTHWVKWSGCACIDKDEEGDCMDDFYSWECDVHDPVKEAA